MAGPVSLRDQAVAIGKQFAEAETKLAGQVASRLSNGITQPGWAEAKLAQVQALNKELQVTIDTTMEDAQGPIGDLMTDAYASAQKATVNAGEAGDALRGNLGSMNTAAMSALYGATYGRIEAGGDQMLRSSMDAYRGIIADAAAGVVSGVDTRIGATQAALNEFATQGITGFTDTAGRAWSMSSYAEMATRTAATRSYTEGKLDTFRAAGISMFQLSSDGSPCDVCAPWEGEIVVDDGAENPDGLPTISEMEGDGVFHANCGHTLDAVSDAAYDSGIVTEEKMTDEELANAAEDYKNAQTQRYMERQVQGWKTRDAVAITPEAKAQSGAKISEWQGKLRDFTESTGLPRYYDREGVRVGVADAPAVVPEPVVPEHAGPDLPLMVEYHVQNNEDMMGVGGAPDPVKIRGTREYAPVDAVGKPAFGRGPSPFALWTDLASRTGMSFEALTVQSESVLQSVIDKKDLTINAPLSVTRKILDDGRIKSQFETNYSRGNLDGSMRSAAEQYMFGYSKGIPVEDRPIYGSFTDLSNTSQNSVRYYGETQFVLTDAARARSTAVWTDSLGAPELPSPANDVSWMSFRPDDAQYATAGVTDWREMAAKAMSAGGENFGVINPTDYRVMNGSPYIEAQVHGGVSMADVSEIRIYDGYGNGMKFIEHENPGLIDSLTRAGFVQAPELLVGIGGTYGLGDSYIMWRRK